MELLNRIPNWLRWIIFIPCAVATFLLFNLTIRVTASYLLIRLENIPSAFNIVQLGTEILATFLGFTSSMLVGILIAPKHKKGISVILGAACIAIMIFSLIIHLSNPKEMEYPLYIVIPSDLIGILGVALVAGSYLRTYRE